MSRVFFAGGRGESPLALEAIEEIATLEPLTPTRSRIAGALPYAMAGAALVVGVAVFGSYLGKSAVARSGPGVEWTDVTEPSVTTISRVSLTSTPLDLESQGYSFEIGQQVTASLKSDMLTDNVVERPNSILLRPAVLPLAKPRVLSSQEPQYAVPEIRALMRRIAEAKVPCLSLMNMPPMPYLKRIPGLDAERLAACFTAPEVWKDFEPGLVSLCSPDPQARTTSSAPASSGMPDLIPTTRAANSVSLSVGTVVVKTIWSNFSGAMADFATAARAAWPAISVSSTPLSEPP